MTETRDFRLVSAEGFYITLIYLNVPYRHWSGVGWLSWGQLRRVLEITREQFRTQAEKGFVDDLILYLDYKIREGERIRTERKQLNFW